MSECSVWKSGAFSAASAVSSITRHEMAALPRLSSCAAPKEMLFVRAKMSVEGTHAMRSARGEFLEAPLLIQSESRSFDSARTSVPEVLAALRMTELS